MTMQNVTSNSNIPSAEGQSISGQFPFSISLSGSPVDTGQILETGEFLDYFLVRYLRPDSVEFADKKSEESFFARQKEELMRRPFSRFLFARQEELDPSAFRNLLRKIFEQQDEMIFIEKGGNLSASLLRYGLPAHWRQNNYFDLVYVFSGEARYFFEGETLFLAPGDFLLVPPAIRHGETPLAADARIISCAVRQLGFWQLFFPDFSENVFLRTLLRPLGDNPGTLKYLLFHTASPGEQTDSVISGLFEQLLQEQDTLGPHYNKMSEAFLHMILARLLRDYENRLELPKDSSIRWKPEYADIFRYLTDNYTTVSLQELSEKFHYSRRQLMRIIREGAGKNFGDLVREMKLKKARDLLKETDMSIEDIAGVCGYEDSSAFSRAYLKFYGCTPGAERG